MEVAGTTTVKTPPEEPEPDCPARIHSAKPISFSNGVLKRFPHAPPLFTYKECLKNHAASMGGHAVDGCGEFMPSPTSTPSDPTSLKCAACGCHRNFHRRDPDDPSPATPLPTIEYQPHHRHHPPPPPRSPNSPSSPPPISSSYYPSAPRMLLALSSAAGGPNPNPNPNPNAATNHHNYNPNHHTSTSSGSRKRFRTKFTQSQKDKMYELAERLGWKMQKRDEDSINSFCNNIGVEKGVFKVWMHNNKNTLGKNIKDNSISPIVNGTTNTTRINLESSIVDNHRNNENGNSDEVVGTNGSSSSS